MKAVMYNRYGPPDVLCFKEIGKPTPKDGEILVRVHATTVNRTDCATIRAKPWFARFVTGLLHPKRQIPGTEFSGTIEAVGKSVTSLQVGDPVFGFDDQGSGAHAEYLTIIEDMAIKIPANISYEQAAASSEGAHYAYNFINKVKLEKGQTVLVNGATGAIGSAAVQLLNYFEMNITAVCPTQNRELVQSLGAHRIIDYEREDFTKDTQKYNYVFDTVGKSSFFKVRELLKPGGVYISSDLGYMAQNLFLPPATSIIKPLIDNKKTLFPIPVDIRASLNLIQQLMKQGKFKAVIDKIVPFENIVEAYRYVEKGQKTGNMVINVVSD